MAEQLKYMRARLDLFREAEKIEAEMDKAYQDLRRFEAVPIDKDDYCRCGTTINHSIPPEFAGQLQEVHRASRGGR